MLTLKILVGCASDKGIKPRNEDFVGVHFPDGSELTLKGAVAAIADGMSSSEAGQHASQCCVVSFLADYYSTPDSWSVKHAAQKFYPPLIRGFTVKVKRVINPQKAWSAP